MADAYGAFLFVGDLYGGYCCGFACRHESVGMVGSYCILWLGVVDVYRVLEQSTKCLGKLSQAEYSGTYCGCHSGCCRVDGDLPDEERFG